MVELAGPADGFVPWHAILQSPANTQFTGLMSVYSYCKLPLDRVPDQTRKDFLYFMRCLRTTRVA
jgi:hypothetical protein